MSNLLYFFDGTEGCDRCQAMTGYYIHFPSKPHANCDCFIGPRHVGDLIRVELRPIGTTNIRIGPSNAYIIPFAKIKITESMAQGPGLNVSASHTFHNFVQVTPEMNELFDIEEKFARSFEHEHSLHIHRDILEEGDIIEIDVVGVVDQIIFTAEKFLIYDGPNGPIEVSLGLIEEEIEIVSKSFLHDNLEPLKI